MTHHSSNTNNNTTEPPAPEVLRPQADHSDASAAAPSSAATPKRSLRLGHMTYRPSHKATFIGLAVVAAILLINVVVISFVMNSQATSSSSANKEEVTISSDVLNKLGVSRNPVSNAGTELIVGPNARFNGKVVVSGDVSVAGELKLSSKFSASDASLAKLEAGKTSLSELNINGDATATSLNLRKDLTVLGATRLQGPVTISQLLTVNNNMNVAGNLAVGGVLSARGFQASSLVSDTTLTIGGHIITRGAAPGVGPSSALGANGTVSISGNDAAGTVAANVGTGGGNGILAHVAFRQQYSATPHVVVTAIGTGAGSVYVNRSAGGFSIGVSNPLAPGGYAFDYIVMQ